MSNYKKPDRPSIRQKLKTTEFYVDYLYETYKPLKNPSGEYYYNGVVYITDEVDHYMDSPEELKIVETMGLEIVGFLHLLRIQMGKFSGFGIQVNNNDIKKALSNIEIDYSIDRDRLFYLYEQLKEKGIIFLIQDSRGNKYATTIQQLFNWEYKMYERVLNKIAKQKQRDKEKSIDSDNSTEIASKTPVYTIENIPREPAEGIPMVGSDFDDILDSENLEDDTCDSCTDDGFFGGEETIF